MHTPTHFIKRKAAASLLHSPRTACAIGRPLNTFVTINFWQFGVSPENAYETFKQLRDGHFQRWSAYKPVGFNFARNGPPTYSWAMEAPNQLVHLHWMLHIANAQKHAFRVALNKWLKHLLRTDAIPDGAIDIRPAHNPEGLKLYLAKGIDPALGKQWNIKPIQSGMVATRRSGTSRNLGPGEWRPRKSLWKENQQTFRNLAGRSRSETTLRVD